MRECINPKICKLVPKNRQLVDLNDNEVAITENISVVTELNGVSAKMDWWEIKSNVKPIPGMDNFGKMNLKVRQGQEEKVGLVRTETEQLMFHTKIEQEFGELFTRQGTIRNFEYGVKFKEAFIPFQQKGRKLLIHLQTAVQTQLTKLINSGQTRPNPGRICIGVARRHASSDERHHK